LNRPSSFSGNMDFTTARPFHRDAGASDCYAAKEERAKNGIEGAADLEKGRPSDNQEVESGRRACQDILMHRAHRTRP
jgi:hypothetical protein